nr:GNAT family N-acetyltransferase [Kineosporia mesophila]
MGGPVLGLPGFRGYLARTADGAVGTALSTVKDGALCVFNVAVRPSARGRGIGRALTEAALAQDFTVACLQSSTAGRPLYESMGFRAAERWHTLEPA